MSKYALLTRPFVTFRKMQFKNHCSMCSTFYYLSFDQFVNNEYVKRKKKKGTIHKIDDYLYQLCWEIFLEVNGSIHHKQIKNHRIQLLGRF